MAAASPTISSGPWSPRLRPSTQRGTAWERFTGEGLSPCSFQGPLRFVWSMRPATAEKLQGLPDPEFLARLRQPSRKLEISARQPPFDLSLSLRRSAAQASARVLAIGTPRRRSTRSPTSLNLGLRDAWNWLRCCLTLRRKRSARKRSSLVMPAGEARRQAGIGLPFSGPNVSNSRRRAYAERAPRKSCGGRECQPGRLRHRQPAPRASASGAPNSRTIRTRKSVKPIPA